jgi:HdeA/HdeB family protein
MEWSAKMYRALIFATILSATAIPVARAQVDLSTYADANGFLNVQKLTCAQLAGTWQGDADRLTAWYSGWYNGLARKHYMDIVKSKEAEHEVIVYCKAHPEQLIIEAIAVVFKDMRAKLGIEMKP